MKSWVLAFFQKSLDEGELHGWFPPWDSDSPAWLFIENTITKYLCQQLVNRIILSDLDQCFGRASHNTRSAPITRTGFYAVRFIFLDRLLGTSFKTRITIDTVAAVKADLRLLFKWLGILTPLAAHHTAFHEHCSPNPWSIIQRETLDIKNYSG